MKVGDRVTMSPMWIHEKATGEIIKMTKGYIVVSWDGVNGEWHYTEEQATRLDIINEAR